MRTPRLTAAPRDADMSLPGPAVIRQRSIQSPSSMPPVSGLPPPPSLPAPAVACCPAVAAPALALCRVVSGGASWRCALEQPARAFKIKGEAGSMPPTHPPGFHQTNTQQRAPSPFPTPHSCAAGPAAGGVPHAGGRVPPRQAGTRPRSVLKDEAACQPGATPSTGSLLLAGWLAGELASTGAALALSQWQAPPVQPLRHARASHCKVLANQPTYRPATACFPIPLCLQHAAGLPAGWQAWSCGRVRTQGQAVRSCLAGQGLPRGVLHKTTPLLPRAACQGLALRAAPSAASWRGVGPHRRSSAAGTWVQPTWLTRASRRSTATVPTPGQHATCLRPHSTHRSAHVQPNPSSHPARSQ